MEEKDKSFGRLFGKNLIGNIKCLLIVSPLIIMSGFLNYTGNPIKSQRELDSLIITESNKLELNSRNISGKFGECPNPSEKGMTYNKNPRSAYVGKIGKNNYEIILDQIRTKNTLQHELYHIYDNSFADHKKGYNIFEMLTNEIQANIYSSTGIKTSLK